ncbi:hypothetical protein ACPC54_23750 [Kitasatospora sp. NPDC094028]
MTGQRRGPHHNPVHDAVKALFVFGHLAVIGLLGVTVYDQETSHSAYAATDSDSGPPNST